MKKGISLVVQVLVVGFFFFHLPNLEAKAESIGFSVGDHPSGQLKLIVVDDLNGLPISDAQVSVSEGPLKTITVQKKGYASTTILGLSNSKVTVFLKPLPDQNSPDRTVIASGSVNRWTLDQDLLSKPVQLGLVFRSLPISELLHFNLDHVISPLKDTVDIWGKRKIPSNVVMPDQSIPIMGGVVRLNKSDYRFPTPEGETTRMVLSQGYIQSSDLISLAGQDGKVSADLLNKFHFTHLGITDSFIPTHDFKLNLESSFALTSGFTVKVKQPPFISDVLTTSVADLQGDWQSLIPTDIKAPWTVQNFRGSGSVILLKAENLTTKRYEIFTLALSEDLRRFSGIITEATSSNVEQGEFIPAEAIPERHQLPDEIPLQGQAGEINEVVFESLDQENPKKTYPIAYIFILPKAGLTKIFPREIPLDRKVSQYKTVRLEFKNPFDEKHFDGQTLLHQLKRFSTSVGVITP